IDVRPDTVRGADAIDDGVLHLLREERRVGERRRRARRREDGEGAIGPDEVLPRRRPGAGVEAMRGRRGKAGERPEDAERGAKGQAGAHAGGERVLLVDDEGAAARVPARAGEAQRLELAGDEVGGPARRGGVELHAPRDKTRTRFRRRGARRTVFRTALRAVL